MKPSIRTTKRAFPMIYAYSTPQIAEHDGWTKIGYTENNDVETRIAQQTHTSDTETKLEWKGSAIYDDGTGDTFTDREFHAYLRKDGVENKKGTEWFHIDGFGGREKFNSFRYNRGILKATDVVPYKLRKEQQEAVQVTKNYYQNNKDGEFLWNAKPRFGKTLTVYDFCKQIGARKILIVTNRPAIANSWYSDYAKFLGDPSGYRFISEAESLKNKPYVLTRKQYLDSIGKGTGTVGFIEFVSLQDLKGSIYFGGKFNKLKEIGEIEWDVLVIDEAHEGVDTQKTDVAFEQINRKFTLHLSGTPFKALAKNKFDEKAVYNWTYADEQKAKRDWVGESDENNPYATLPSLNLYTYQMSDIVRDELERGIEIEGETEEYAFDLNEFFSAKNEKFVHDSSVDKFLDALTKQEKFPFSTPELRKELKHTFWYLNRVESAKALSRKLREHPVFSKYHIILAAGDGSDEDEASTIKAYDKVKAAIAKYEYTITLSVGQLTTGITIPEWTAVMMLCNLSSPALYMQAAFRSQNPCLFRDKGEYWRKENAYVFDFDPARTLTIFEEFANDLSLSTASGRGNSEQRKENIRELLNFFPVIGEDDSGEMIKLDAEKVLSIPRKIRSIEVVRRGFMSNYLFQNINCVFGAPKEVIDIIESFQAIEEPKARRISSEDVAKLNINPKTGDIDISNEQVIGTASRVFGDKIYGEKEQNVVINLVDDLTQQKSTDGDTVANKVAEIVSTETVDKIVEVVKNVYKDNVRANDTKAISKVVTSKIKEQISKVYANNQIEQKKAEQDHLSELRNRDKSGKTVSQIKEEFESKQEELNQSLKAEILETVKKVVDESQNEIIKTVETKIQERKKNAIEGSVRDHLRGFSRTIPAFLMAYGSDQVMLENFDQVIPDHVFHEVTSITLDQFRFLRDGGDYLDPNTGETKHFQGNLFDPVVFNDSVREFLHLKKRLANYFDDRNAEDIFDYIPSQRTNQIFTPRAVVRQMVDFLEQENPGCFDDPTKSFVDLYMKSGMYISEIVKRLYNSPHMRELFPNSTERLKHIFKKQVFGLAPTEIIYRIAISYILGFDDSVLIQEHNFRQIDALVYAKNGSLSAELDRAFSQTSKQ